MGKEVNYAKMQLLKSGIDFHAIPKEHILLTCKEYQDKISPENYNAIIQALEEIYKNLQKSIGNKQVTNKIACEA